MWLKLLFHLTFSSYAYFILYHIWENSSLLYWPRRGSALWWIYFKFSILYLFLILIWETVLYLTFERCKWMFMFLDNNKCSIVECFNIVMLSTVKMTFSHTFHNYILIWIVWIESVDISKGYTVDTPLAYEAFLGLSVGKMGGNGLSQGPFWKPLDLDGFPSLHWHKHRKFTTSLLSHFSVSILKQSRWRIYDLMEGPSLQI